MAFSFGPGLKQRLSDNLQAFDVCTIDDSDLRQAAVAIVVGPGGEGDGRNSEATFLLTLRPKTIKRHSGQYALPGGRLDPGETTVDAALRELDEELGLRLGPDDVLGTLDDYPTRSGFRITPVVAWTSSSANLIPAPDEVYKIFRIPLGQLDRPDIPELSAPPVSVSSVEARDKTDPTQQPVLSMTLPALGHAMYAPTAALLYQFREVALRGAKTRVAHYDQPGFAWK